MADLNVSELVGSWALVEWRIDYPDARPSAWPFGKDAIGLLVYAPDGWMSATMSRRDRAGLPSGSAGKPDDAWKARCFGEYLAYCGRFRVQGSRIEHDIEMSMNPILIGQPHAREAKVEAGILTLRADEPGPGGSVRVHHIVWRRPA